MNAAVDPVPLPAPVEEYQGKLDAAGVTELIRRARPVVIRGLVRDWPIVKLARESHSAFARRLAELDNGADITTLMVDPEAEGIIGYKPGMTDFNYKHFKVPMTLGLRRLAKYSQQPNAPGLVIQSVLVNSTVPGLLLDHQLACVDPKIEPRLWIGNRTTTPIHFDVTQNIACVICGGRRFTLFPPDQLPNLYVGPLDFAPTGAAISLVRLDQPDDPRFPRFRQALARAQTVDMEPGDAIYIPPLWWHHVQSLQNLNALMNYWWTEISVPGYDTAFGRAALYHCLLAFRALPPEQRKTWQDLINYYVFGERKEFAHIPEARLGVLGPLTEATLKTLREGARVGL